MKEAPIIDSLKGPSAAVPKNTGPALDETRAVAVRIAEIIADTPAADTVVLDIHQLSSFADYFVICSGENERQLKAIADTISMKLAEAGIRPNREEGTAASGWIVIDYGDIIVHVFDVDQREFYRLEALWEEAPTLLVMQ